MVDSRAGWRLATAFTVASAALAGALSAAPPPKAPPKAPAAKDATPPAAFPAGPNLVKNPGFEEAGPRGPASWDPPDDLTSFWVPDDRRGGKCIRLLSSILLDDYHRRLEEMKLPVPPPPRPARPFKPPGYDTVGGNDGVTYWSDWIDCKPATRYAFAADVRSEGGTPKIFIKGYSEIPAEIDDNGKPKKVLLRRVTFKIFLDAEGGKDWRTSTIDFCPTHDREDVKWMRVMFFAYWPPQSYWFDNIRLVEAGPDAEAPKRWAAHKQRAESEAAADREAKAKEAKYALDYVRKAVARYLKDLGAPPPGLGALLKDPGDPKWLGPYLMELGEDPWGNPFKYAVKKEGGFTLKSTGPDGEDGGGDDIE